LNPLERCAEAAMPIRIPLKYQIGVAIWIGHFIKTLAPDSVGNLYGCKSLLFFFSA
jgi:hypothetical protein